jgi:hypothetical protein
MDQLQNYLTADQDALKTALQIREGAPGPLRLRPRPG